MKIYFCDGCNESVPLAEVQAGRVTTIAGKLFCKSCIPPSALQPPVPAAAQPVGRSGSPLLWGLVVALAGWTVWGEVEPLLAEPEAAPVETGPTEVDVVRRDLAELEAELQAVAQGGIDRGRELAALSQAADADRAASESLDKRLATQEAEMLRVTRGQAAAAQLIEKVQRNTNKVASMEARMDSLSDAVAAHQAALDYGAPLAAGGGAGAGVADGLAMGGGTAAPAEPAMDPARAAELEAIRRLLLDPEPDVRFDGVDQVEQGGYVELASDLVQLLQDEDMFVRLHAMNVLGNFGYEDAIPALFEVLEDGNASIRRTAGETLVRLTGYDPGFEHKGSSGERSRAIRKWREWYEERGS